MSTTTSIFGAAPTRDQLVASATSLNSLIQTAESADPALAAQLKTKAALYSKTNWAVPLSMLLTWLGTKYGIALDADTQTAVTVAVGTVVTWIMRRFTKGAVSGVIATPVA